MILQALAGYYQRMAQDNHFDVAPEGFEKKAIPFVIVLDSEGHFVDLLDTREGEGKKKASRIFTVPKGVKKTSGIAANLLWDTTNYVLGIPKNDPHKNEDELHEKAIEQHRAFVKKITDSFVSAGAMVGIRAVLAFCAGDKSAILAHPSWNDLAESGANVTFKLVGDSCLICQRQEIIDILSANSDNGEQSGKAQVCLVSGNEDVPIRLHTAIKGVWGAQSSGANIVSFNLDAFCSYAKEQGMNAPVGQKAEFAYTTALNILLARESRQKLAVGDMTIVFWAEQPTVFEDIFADVFGEPSKENPEQHYAAIRALYSGPESGAQPLEQDYTRFYVLGLAPNAARIAIRFWHAGTVGETARHIKQHFADCAIVHGPNQPEYLSLFRMLVNTAAQGKAENILPNLAGDFMKSILMGTAYPKAALNAVINRLRAEQAKNDQNGKSVPNVTYPRVALIKAILCREARYYHHLQKEVDMALDPDNINIGYRLGRLFAVLEKIQEEASPGINSTIRDRFYGAASGVPVTAFPQLMKLKNHHLSKLENRGRAVNLERMLGDIMSGIDDFPVHLSLQDQGRFAVGYYHQRQEFYKKSDTPGVSQ